MKASPTLASNLQMVLTDLIELHLQGKQAHWNLVGTNFRDLHLQLDEIVSAARLFADEVAERMRPLHALPDGRSSTVTADNRLAGFPAGLTSTKDTVKLITTRLERTVNNHARCPRRRRRRGPHQRRPAAHDHRTAGAVGLDGQRRNHGAYRRGDRAGQQVGGGGGQPGQRSGHTKENRKTAAAAVRPVLLSSTAEQLARFAPGLSAVGGAAEDVPALLQLAVAAGTLLAVAGRRPDRTCCGSSWPPWPPST